MGRDLGAKRLEAADESQHTAVQDTGGGSRPARATTPESSPARPPLPSRIADSAVQTFMRHRLLLDVIMLGAGVAIAPLAGVAHLSVRPVIAGRGTSTGIAWGSVFIVSTLIAMRLRGLYELRLQLNPLEDFSRILSATSTGAILLISLRVIANSVNGASNQAFRLWAGSTICLTVGRVGLAAVIRHRQRAGELQFATLIIGCEAVGELIARRLADRPELGMRPVGFLDDERLPGGNGAEHDFPILGTTDDLARIVQAHGIQHVIVGFGGAPHDRLLALMRTCRRMGLVVSIVPRLLEEVGSRVEVEHLGGIPLLRSEASDPRGWQFSVKYALDRVIAALLVILSSPLLILIALAVRVSSRGPIFYRQQRVSLDGREFEMLKFRTMHGNEHRDGHWDAHWVANPLGRGEGAAGPDRRTTVGRVLRRLSLDELPQLFNVLRGDMSLVGPRPERTAYAHAFSERVYRYGDRHRVKSGLTGWAQVHGLRGQTSLADRVEWDNYYIENWNLLLDFKILLLTIPAMFTRSGAA
jgi:exopolysaccharide biosynthesis polyprenyl glycosylphosphotransferase